LASGRASGTAKGEANNTAISVLGGVFVCCEDMSSSNSSGVNVLLNSDFNYKHGKYKSFNFPENTTSGKYKVSKKF